MAGPRKSCLMRISVGSDACVEDRVHCAHLTMLSPMKADEGGVEVRDDVNRGWRRPTGNREGYGVGQFRGGSGSDNVREMEVTERRRARIMQL